MYLINEKNPIQIALLIPLLEALSQYQYQNEDGNVPNFIKFIKKLTKKNVSEETIKNAILAWLQTNILSISLKKIFFAWAANHAFPKLMNLLLIEQKLTLTTQELATILKGALNICCPEQDLLRFKKNCNVYNIENIPLNEIIIVKKFAELSDIDCIFNYKEVPIRYLMDPNEIFYDFKNLNVNGILSADQKKFIAFLEQVWNKKYFTPNSFCLYLHNHIQALEILKICLNKNIPKYYDIKNVLNNNQFAILRLLLSYYNFSDNDYSDYIFMAVQIFNCAESLKILLNYQKANITATQLIMCMEYPNQEVIELILADNRILNASENYFNCMCALARNPTFPLKKLIDYIFKKINVFDPCLEIIIEEPKKNAQTFERGQQLEQLILKVKVDWNLQNNKAYVSEIFHNTPKELRYYIFNFFKKIHMQEIEKNLLFEQKY